MVLTIAGNIGQKQTCKICLTDDETTEHVFLCTGIKNEDKLTPDDILKTDKYSLLKVLKLFNEYKCMQEKVEQRTNEELHTITPVLGEEPRRVGERGMNEPVEGAK
jgi:hypothetical protein